MFYEKWFDKGDLVIFEADYSYILYDEENKPYSMREMGPREIDAYDRDWETRSPLSNHFT